MQILFNEPILYTNFIFIFCPMKGNKTHFSISLWIQQILYGKIIS